MKFPDSLTDWMRSYNYVNDDDSVIAACTDANGNRTRVTYPSSRVVTYTFDFADRPLSAVSGATTYVSG